MTLSKDELAQLEALQAKEKEPPEGRQEHFSVTVDLSDERAVKRAIKLGYLQPADLDDDAIDNDDADDDDGDADDDAEDDDAAAGKKSRKRDPAPKRRLNLADRTLGGDQ